MEMYSVVMDIRLFTSTTTTDVFDNTNFRSCLERRDELSNLQISCFLLFSVVHTSIYVERFD
jgi:hypothetical protein